MVLTRVLGGVRLHWKIDKELNGKRPYLSLRAPIMVGDVWVMMRFKEFLKMRKVEKDDEIDVKPADCIAIYKEGQQELSILKESKWLSASYEKEIRIDRNTHLHSGDKHAHIYDRKGNEIYALTQLGKPSHDAKPFRLSKNQADALSGQGFDIPKSRVVEAVFIGSARLLLLG